MAQRLAPAVLDACVFAHCSAEAGHAAMLAALGAAMPVGGAPVAIDFAPGELAVRGLPLAGPQRDLLLGKLRDQGYQVRVDNERMVMRQQGKP